MGRRDAVQVVLEVVSAMRALEPRLVVSYEPGWETRGNGTTANYEGGLWHHTASASSATNPLPTQRILRDGRPDLTGPLCNFAGPWCSTAAPRIHVMAANPANHAGASGGKSMGPLPVTSLFNPRVLGLEVDYSGLAPMSDGQAYVAKLWGWAVAVVVGGGDINRLRAHAETSVTGKWDIGYANGKTYDMNALRRDAAALATEGLDMAITEQRISEIVVNALTTPLIQWPKESGNAPTSVLTQLRLNAEGLGLVYREVQALKDAKGSPAAAIPGGIDYAALAKALADEQDRRARDGDPKTGPVS